MAVSEVEIGNLALDLLDETPIVSFDDGNKAARLLKRNYPQVRDRLLRTYRWNFAITRAELAPDSTAPLFGFTYKFRKPNDIIHFVGVFDEDAEVSNYTSGSIPHKLEGEFIHANENPLFIFYLARIIDPTKFDVFFIDLVSVDLAQRISYGLTSGNKRTADLTKMREQVLSDAKIADAFEGTPEIVESTRWIDSHDGFRFVEGVRNRNAI
jgi:hypothetical protein